MMTKRKYGFHLALVLLLLAAVAACSGGGGGGGGGGITPLYLGTVSTSLTHTGSIAAYGTDFYSFTTGTISGNYTISLTNTQSDLSWAFADPGFTTPIMVCDNFWTPGANDEICPYTLTAGTTYYLAVDEWEMVAGTYTLSITAPSPPAAPVGVSATAGSAKVIVSWPAVTGATSYNIYWSTTPGGALSGGNKISGITTMGYYHLVPATSIPYYYVVTAQNDYGESAKSSPEVSAIPRAKKVPPVAYDFDDGTLQEWVASGTWNVSTTYANSGAYSVTDSPLGNYQNGSDTRLLSPMIDLTATTAPKLTFWHRHNIETYYDKGYVELSTDGGTTWTNITPIGFYNYFTGSLSTFTLVTIDLSPYKSSSQVHIRFRLQTDSIFNDDGWYIDDIAVSVN